MSSGISPAEALDLQPLATMPVDAFWCGTVEYQRGFEAMNDMQRARVASAAPDTLLYLQHDPVITYGRATRPDDLFRRPHNLPTVAVPRGGLATYHGPGQLIGYCVVDLTRRAGAAADIHHFIRALEQAIIRFLDAHFGLKATTRPGYTGVWMDGEPMRKIAAIGICARRWVTSHGFALNIDPDLTPFESIVPCGITDAGVTSVAEEFRRIQRHFPSLQHADTPEMHDYAAAMHPHVVSALQQAGWWLGETA